MLRVLNDDFIEGGGAFPLHPHDNMEIVTIPLTGALQHQDNTGGHGIIKAGDIQIMSAGSGIQHSEANASKIGIPTVSHLLGIITMSLLL
jgi:redox-sensitive bicupin YhaK (pirin superfamily)